MRRNYTSLATSCTRVPMKESRRWCLKESFKAWELHLKSSHGSSLSMMMIHNIRKCIPFHTFLSLLHNSRYPLTFFAEGFMCDNTSHMSKNERKDKIDKTLQVKDCPYRSMRLSWQSICPQCSTQCFRHSSFYTTASSSVSVPITFLSFASRRFNPLSGQCFSHSCQLQIH